MVCSYICIVILFHNHTVAVLLAIVGIVLILLVIVWVAIMMIKRHRRLKSQSLVMVMSHMCSVLESTLLFRTLSSVDRLFHTYF